MVEYRPVKGHEDYYLVSSELTSKFRQLESAKTCPGRDE